MAFEAGIHADGVHTLPAASGAARRCYPFLNVTERSLAYGCGLQEYFTCGDTTTSPAGVFTG